MMGLPQRQGLYDPRNEHDACGVGFVANIKGRKSHEIIGRGLEILVNLDHRGAVGADPLVGDGAGCLIQMPDRAAARLGATGGRRICRRPADYAVAMCFLPREAAARDYRDPPFREVRRQVEGQTLVGWRDVPTDIDRPGQDGDRADAGDPPGDRRRAARGSSDQDAFERKILAIRKQTAESAGDLASKHNLPGLTELYMPSLLHPHGGLQGPAAGAAGRQLLSTTCATR